MMKANIVVVGSSNTDMIIKLDRIPKPGETRLGGEFLTAAGGKGANQAVAAARAGGSVAFVARVGQDMFGEQAVAGLVENGVDVQFVQFDKAPSGVALIFVGEDGENSIAVGSGANAKLSPADVRKAKAAIADADVVVMQLESPLETVETAARLAAAGGATVILNPAPAQPLSDKLLKHITILTPNESETELLTGVRISDDASCVRAADILRARGVETVIITLGSQGAFVASPTLSERVPGYSAKPVDTTAAGDTFNGALAVALAERVSILEAVRFANAAGAISVTRVGAQPSAPTRREIEKLVKGKLSRTDAPAKHSKNGSLANGGSRRRAVASP
ncbi:ribokinase [Lacipirellula parvula]|uniref:Ribokinase n=1 Tax=Lacipirellula parvula TaxID=2650471 RepID=A0A5K7XBB8_9BACT|nr:ribokinase [Lacipirellula parvula]BBO33317.1 ribokinase [Lacipirellula parvula]